MNHESMPSAERYKPSGKLGPGGLFLPVIVAALGVLAGYGAGQISDQINHISAGFVASFLASMLIGWCCLGLAKALKCRSSFWVFASVILGVLIAMHAFAVSMISSSWKGQKFIFRETELWIDPGLTFKTLWNWNVGHVMQAACTLFAFGYVWYLYRRQVFCETCDTWLDITRTFLLLPMPRTPEAKAAIDAGDLEHVATHIDEQHLRLPVRPFVRLDYVLCNGCGNCGAYQFMLIYGRRIKGQDHRDEKPLSYLMRLNEISTRHLAVLIHAQKGSSVVAAMHPKKRTILSRAPRKTGPKPDVNSSP